VLTGESSALRCCPCRRRRLPPGTTEEDYRTRLNVASLCAARNRPELQTWRLPLGARPPCPPSAPSLPALISSNARPPVLSPALPPVRPAAFRAKLARRPDPPAAPEAQA